jgi:Major Facilitator Superfamily
MMGSLIYLSVSLQFVVGYSPTMAGLAILPMMLGIMPASIIGGRLISKIGRYRPFPIAGTAIAAIGMLLMSRLNEHTSALDRGLYMWVLGLGLGLVMPVLTLAVQNALPLKDIGTGTSSNLFFRNMGSSFGTAIFGAILTNRMTHNIAASPRASALGGSIGAGGLNRQALDATNAANPGAGIEATVLHAFVNAMSLVFVIAGLVMVIAFILSLFLKQVTLRVAGGPVKPGSEPVPEVVDAAPAMH